jgi:hypothetical protein
MTADIRHSAIEHGWRPSVASNTHVNYNGKRFSVDVHEDHYGTAHIHEYGDENVRPTAVVRKYGNNTHQAERALTKSFMRHLGGKL